MTSHRPRRIAAATLALAATAALSACGTGIDTQTNRIYQPAIGANVRGDDIQVHNALLVLNDDETFSFSGGVVNETDREQTLESVTIAPLSPTAGGEQPTQVEPSTEVVIAPMGLTTIGADGELAGLEVEGLGEGRYATITFTFADAGELTVEAPVVARNASYSGVAAEPAETGGESEDGLEEESLDGQSEEDTGNSGDAGAEPTNP